MIEFDEATHQYTVDGEVYASVTQVIADARLNGDAAQYYDGYGRERGLAVHSIIEYYSEGILDFDSVDPALAGYLEAWKRFESESGYVPVHIEHILYHDGIRVAGRADAVGLINGRPAIVDIKTSAARSPATAIQLAGYVCLYQHFAKRLAVHLSADGKYRLHEYTDRNDEWVFLAAVRLYHWRQANIKGGM